MTYNCPKCGWGQQRGLGRSSAVDIVIKDGEVSLADAEEWDVELECPECGEIFVAVYPPIQT